MQKVPLMLKQTLLYTGKAKSVYETDSADHLVLVFRDDASAFNGEKIEQLARKGKVNNRFNAFIMEKLAAAGIETHFEKLLTPTEVLVKKLQMIPVECVIRNYAAGSLCRRLGVEEGKEITPPTNYSLKTMRLAIQWSMNLKRLHWVGQMLSNLLA